MSGPLCSQVPGPTREAGTQADRALGPGRGNDEEGSCRERIETLMEEMTWGIIRLWDRG